MIDEILILIFRSIGLLVLMRIPAHIPILLLLLLQCTVLCAQKNEIFIPLNDRSDISLKPRLDTLDNLQEYEFRIRVSPEFKISQFLFEKGLAIQNDSVLKIIPNSTKYGDHDTATLKVIVSSVRGSRIMLFQKRFIIRVPDKMYPVLNNNRTNMLKINDKEFLERNTPYPIYQFTVARPFITMYENDKSEKKYEVKNVTIALYEKEGKQYSSNADTISADAIREIKKLKHPTPVYIKVDALNGKSRKQVWNKIVLYQE